MTIYIHPENTCRYNAFINLLDTSYTTRYKIVSETTELNKAFLVIILHLALPL